MLARLGLHTLILVSPLAVVAVHATDIPALVQKAKPAVVEILTFDQQNNLLKTGTGFFISPDGLLLTNYHVISGGSSIMAKTPTGAVYFLKSVLSASKTYDVAKLQFFATDVPYLTLGSSSGAIEGQRVLVIGNPEGLGGTVSDGIISAFRDNRSMIQITASISPGSSGSPVLDEAGNVVGIVTQVFKEGQNLNFAISSESIRDAIAKSAVVTAKWPDGRKLLHPDQFVRTRVVNVDANDTLKLRSGPGTSFRIVAEIPADETNITAFNYDQIWDGDTWWCPVEWRGLRGYVGRSHLPKP